MFAEHSQQPCNKDKYGSAGKRHGTVNQTYTWDKEKLNIGVFMNLTLNLFLYM